MKKMAARKDMQLLRRRKIKNQRKKKNNQMVIKLLRRRKKNQVLINQYSNQYQINLVKAQLNRLKRKNKSQLNLPLKPRLKVQKKMRIGKIWI